MPYKKNMNGFTRLRLKSGSSVPQLAKNCGLGQTTIYALEDNRHEATAATLHKLFNGLRANGLKNLTFDELLDTIEQYKDAEPRLARRTYDTSSLKKLKKQREKRSN